MKVAIVMGSDSDLPVIKDTIETLEKFGIEAYVSVTSAHRSPKKVEAFLNEADKQGCEVIIAAAGLAAHLPGVIAASTIKPVIGIPMEGGPLNGHDALYAIVQMPAGIPVATVAIGKAGATNAAILAAEILAVKYEVLKEKLKKHREEMAEKVEQKDAKLQEKGAKKYLEGK